MKALAVALSNIFDVPFTAAPAPAATTPPPGTEGSGFDDMESDALDGPAYDSHKPAPAVGPVVYKENCRKCGGTGSYGRVSSLGHSQCTQCKGRGFHEYRHSPDHRAKQRTSDAAAKQRKADAEAMERGRMAGEWLAAHPVARDWLAVKGPAGDAFAMDLTRSLGKWGSLTANQEQAIYKSIARDVDREEAKAKVHAEAKAVDVGEIERVFAAAQGNGLKRPKLLLDEFVIKQASALGRNPGALYVTKKEGDLYMGKVQGGKFIKSRDCTDLDEAAIVAACADPRGAALRYGRLNGACSVCARKLVDPVSVEAGIGPICAEKYGF